MFLKTKYKVISNLYIRSVTRVKTTPVAEKIFEFYEIAQFSLKTTPFYKKRPHFIENYPFFIENCPPFIKTTYGLLICRKLQRLISAFIKNQFSKPPHPIGKLDEEFSFRGANPVEHNHPYLLNVYASEDWEEQSQ